MSSHVEQIKERLSIVDVVSSYVKLEKAGVNYKARCPFHNEKTPSFTVSPARNTFYCFGCGAKGDVFSFIEQFEGTDFKGALKTLADRAGVELVPVNKEVEDQKTRLYKVLEEATTLFEANLEKHTAAKAYVKERGIQSDTLTEWRIGYAEPSWSTLSETLKNRGYSNTDMLNAGLTKPSPKRNGYYDRFRGRVMFPIMDASGRVVAYSGRILPLTSNSEFKEDTAKYINSPETTLYEKSRILYGYHKAKHAIRKHNFSILVEGQMDVVLSHQAGFPNTVAASGTALTEYQILLLSRLSGNIVMAFDADSAGIAAGSRGIDLALQHGMDVKVAALPAGKDPADLVVEGSEKWRAAIRGAKHVIEFYLDYLEEQHSDLRKRRVAVGQTVIPYIAKIPDAFDQAHFVELVAKRLGIAEDPVWESVRNARRSTTGAEHTDTKEPSRTERSIPRQFVIRNRLFGILALESAKAKDAQVIDVEKLSKELREVLGEEEYQRWHTKFIEEGDMQLFEIEKLYTDTTILKNETEDLLEEFKREELRRKYAEAMEHLEQAEAEGDEQKVATALAECKKIGDLLNH